MGQPVKVGENFGLRIVQIGQIAETIKNAPILKPHLSTAENLKRDPIRVRVDDVLMFSGRQAGSMPNSTNLPDDDQLVKKMGTKIIIYKNGLDVNFQKRHYPFVQKMVIDGYKADKKRMVKALQRLIILHELTEWGLHGPFFKLQ